MSLNQNKLALIYKLSALLILVLGATYSLRFYHYIYDGHHHGLIYSYSKDLLNGRIPYKQIWIQYGLLQPLINTFFLNIYDNLLTIQIVTIFFYYLGIFYIYKIAQKYLGSKYSLLILIFIIFNHPIPLNVWPNYYAFFFISSSFYYKIFETKYNQCLSGFLIGLLPLLRSEFLLVFFLYLILLIFLYFFKKRFLFFQEYLLCSILPLIIFLSYLILNNLIFEYIEHVKIFQYYIDGYQTSKLYLIYNFLKFYFFTSFLNLMNEPQYILISLILIFNFFFLKLILIKNLYFFKLSLFCLILTLMCIQGKQLMNPYTSVIIGILPVSYIFIRIINKNYEKIFFYSIIIISVYSFIFFPRGNIEQLSKIKIEKNYIKNNINYFKYHKWPANLVNSLNLFNDKKNNILKKCKVQYFENLTFDSFYSIASDLNRTRMFPHFSSNKKFLPMDQAFNKNFDFFINKEIKNQNIVILFNEKFDHTKIDLSNKKYSRFLINISQKKANPKYYVLYYPSKCD